MKGYVKANSFGKTLIHIDDYVTLKIYMSEETQSHNRVQYLQHWFCLSLKCVALKYMY